MQRSMAENMQASRVRTDAEQALRPYRTMSSAALVVLYGMALTEKVHAQTPAGTGDSPVPAA